MARLVGISLCACCTEWAWSFCASFVDLCGSIPKFNLIQGMGSIDSLTHIQEIRTVEAGWVLCEMKRTSPESQAGCLVTYILEMKGTGA
eukprot:1152981-Pelagomonas_calceolata.AAC.12